MPLDFPSNPSTGTVYTGTNNIIYTYDGEKWLGSSPQGSIIPSGNLVYDLGNSSYQWRHLYVGTSTIYLGGTTLSVSGGNLTVNGGPVIGGNATTSTLVNGTATVQLLIGGGNNPYILFPQYEGGQLYIQGGELGATGSGTVAISGGAEGGSILLSTYGASLKQWALDTDGILTFPGGGAIYNNPQTGQITIADALGPGGAPPMPSTAFYIDSTGTNVARIIRGNGANNPGWYFKDNGNLTLPNSIIVKGINTNTIAIGNDQTGETNQGSFSIAIGGSAAQSTQSSVAIAIGFRAGRYSQGSASVAIGHQAGALYQGNSSIAFGDNAGVDTQGANAVAIGANAGNTGQGLQTVAIGNQAGAIGQGQRAVAIGSLAGGTNQGQYAVALGNFAGGNNQPANSIVINASGVQLDGSAAGLFISPIRTSTSTNTRNLLYYNSATKEITTSSNSELTFPDGTTSTGASIYVPYATSSSFKITTQLPPIGPPPYGATTFEVTAGKIILPSGNGFIQSGNYYTDPWSLDSANKGFYFPNLSRINYYEAGGALSTGSLQVDVRSGGIFQISLNDSNKTWAFDTLGTLMVPGNINFANNSVIAPLNNDLTIKTVQGSNINTWTFLSTGLLKFPGSSTLTDNTVSSYYLVTASTYTMGYSFDKAYGASQIYAQDSSSGTVARITFNANNGNIYLYSQYNSGAGQNWIFDNTGTVVFPDTTIQSTAWTKAAASVQSTPPASPVTGQLYYDTDDGRTYIYTGAAWIDSNPAGAGGGVTSLTAGTGTFVSTATGAITVWTGNTANLKETFETKNASTGTTTHDCTTNRLFYLTNLGTNFTPNFTNLSLSSGDATSVSLVVVQTSTARSITGVQIASTTSGVTLTWQGSITAPTGNASRTEVFTFSILCTATNSYTVLGMMTSFGGA